jgi:hypothetical protein
MGMLSTLLLYFVYLLIVSYYLIGWIYGRKSNFSLTSAVSILAGGYLLSRMFFDTPFEQLDWYINKNKFKQIAALAKNNQLQKGNGEGIGQIYYIPNQLRLFPPFRDNTVELVNSNSTMKLLYYTDRGFTDDCSLLIYTDIEDEVKEYDEAVKRGINKFKLEENWYLMTY